MVAEVRLFFVVSFTANRKTQSEIEKCIKKIADGIEVFDELLDAVQEQGQKDKFDGAMAANKHHAVGTATPSRPSRCPRCTSLC
jgi:hypothetical protein